jgi:hypothetical protein
MRSEYLLTGLLFLLAIAVLALGLRSQPDFDTPTNRLTVAESSLPSEAVPAKRATGPLVPALAGNPMRDPFRAPERAATMASSSLPPPPLPRMRLPGIPLLPLPKPAEAP